MKLQVEITMIQLFYVFLKLLIVSDELQLSSKILVDRYRKQKVNQIQAIQKDKIFLGNNFEKHTFKNVIEKISDQVFFQISGEKENFRFRKHT